MTDTMLNDEHKGANMTHVSTVTLQHMTTVILSFNTKSKRRHWLLQIWYSPIAHFATKVNSKFDVPPRLLMTRTTDFTAVRDFRIFFTNDATSSLAGEIWKYETASYYHKFTVTLYELRRAPIM